MIMRASLFVTYGLNRFSPDRTAADTPDCCILVYTKAKTEIRLRGYKTFFMLISAELEI